MMNYGRIVYKKLKEQGVQKQWETSRIALKNI